MLTQATLSPWTERQLPEPDTTKPLGNEASRAIVRYTWDVVSLMVVNSSTHQTLAVLLGVKYKEWGVKKKLGGLPR